MKKFIIIVMVAAMWSCDKSETSNQEQGESNQEQPQNNQEQGESTPCITKVYDFCPAPGQHVNTYPAYEEGDTKESILAKIESGFAGSGDGTLISLGGFGGYIIFGFDHTLTNKDGLCDLRIYGNAISTSSEPGIVMVSKDDNGNGVADDEWYEIKGSAHDSATANYSITYNNDGEYVTWSDNQGGSGTLGTSKFPSWIAQSELSFTGTRLEDIYTTSDNTYYYASPLSYGYVDNQPNSSDSSAIDIGWAVDSSGNPANLEGVDFVKVYNSQRQVAGWLGDVSTDITGAEDLHILAIEIFSADLMTE